MSVTDVYDLDVADLPTAEDIALLAPADPGAEPPVQNVEPIDTIPRVDTSPRSVSAVTSAIWELALTIGAIERIAMAKFDALIAQLQSADAEPAPEPVEGPPEAVAEPAPRRGRHVSDEVTLSIHSFVERNVPRHRVETESTLLGLAS